MRETSEILEFNQIITALKKTSHSPMTSQKVDGLQIYQDLAELEADQNRLQEMMDLILKNGRLPISSFEDIKPLVAKAEKDGVLTAEEILTVQNQNQIITQIEQYKKDIQDIGEVIEAEFLDLFLPDQLYQKINNTFDIHGDIKDTASHELYGLRKQELNITAGLRNKMVAMQKEYHDYLSQENLSYRDDHLLLAIKASYQNKVRGLVHSVSASGQTVYLEPQVIVEANHRLLQVQEQIREEVRRILKDISQQIKADAYYLSSNQDYLVQLDFFNLKANYCLNNNCNLPFISSEMTKLSLIKAKHPLIDLEKVVANDIVIDNQKKILLITGSNTGGKTVALKTVGLLTYMALSGLAIPCQEATVPFFKNILVDLGDEQSIEQSLSTFSSHMKRLISINEQVDEDQLVLLDEVGSGTDPREGQALAQAYLMDLVKTNCFVVATTHYNSLKDYAKINDKILVAAVEFDQELMEPTYRLIYNSVGNSYAIEISQRLGLKAEIIQNALQLKNQQLSESDRLIEKLEQEREALRQELAETAVLARENKELKEKYERLINNLNQQRDAILKEARDEANDILESGKNKIDQVIADLLQREQIKQHHIIGAKRQLDLFKTTDDKVEPKLNIPLQVGDTVKVISLNRQGEVIDINNKGGLTVSLGGMKVSLKPSEVEFVAHKTSPKPKLKPIHYTKIATKPQYELNIIGQRFADAMLEVDKFLDTALLNKASQVRIVHGMGSGALRNGVREKLKKNKFVKSYRDGGPNEGGLGATLVYFE